ncbi:MAG: DUF1289 domain-containing protein [Pseudomonadota bacterium]
MTDDTGDADSVWRRDEIESPCVKICVIEPDADLCIGCFRTRAEIAGWSRMSADARRALMTALPERAPRLTRRGRKGGRAARRSDPGASA